MKKSLFLFFTLSIFALILTGCQNFIEGSGFKKQLDEDIAYANAKELSVIISPDENTGSTIPAGKHVVKQGYSFEVSFNESSDYCFIKWIAVSAETGEEVEDAVDFEDATALKTKATLRTDSSDVRIKPLCEARISVKQCYPSDGANKVSYNERIRVYFTKELDESAFIFVQEEIPEGANVKTDVEGNIYAYTIDSKTYLKNIEIFADGFSISDHFSKPIIDNEEKTLVLELESPIEFENSADSITIKVVLSKSICDKMGVTMKDKVEWQYKIIDSTVEKANVYITCNSQEGEVDFPGLHEYSLNKKNINLSFKENSDYQFIKWDYDPLYIKIDDAYKIDTNAQAIAAPGDYTQIAAICAERLKVDDFSPKNASTVSKDSSVIIKFNHALPEDKTQLNNIQILTGGADIKSCFKTPSLNEDTVTFLADRNNPLEIQEKQTKTISVVIPSDFYYELEDGTKVTCGGKNITYNYTVNETTSEKAEVKFEVSTDDSGTLTFGKTVLDANNNTQEFSIGQKINLSFKVKEGYQFNGWKITDADGNDLTANNIFIEDLSSSTTRMNINDACKGVHVKALTSLILKVSSFEPSVNVASNPKDSDITITFNHNLAEDCSSLLNKIKISIDGENSDNLFTSRTLSGNKITIKNSKYIAVTGNQTKTVKVTIPGVFYYTDIVSVYLDDEYTYEYVINSSTKLNYSMMYEVVSTGCGKIKDTGLNTEVTLNTAVQSKKDVINLSFEPASGCKLDNWNIYFLNSDGTEYTGSDSADNYFILDYSDSNPNIAQLAVYDLPPDNLRLVVQACAYLVPVVESVKINNTTSVYNVENTICDSKLYINFNKSIRQYSVTANNSSSTALTRNSALTITKAGSSTLHYEDYFNMTWANDSKTLILTPKPTIKDLVPNDDDIFDFVITLNANGKTITDWTYRKIEISSAINNSFEIPYSIKGQRETVIPVWYGSQYLYDQENTDGKKTINSSAFGSWNETIIKNNHVSDSVYFIMYGNDADSGIKALRVTETFYRTVAGSAGTMESIYTDYVPNGIATNYEYAFYTHTFKTESDGVIKLDFQWIDNAGNVSNTKTWYVIKDTAIDESVLKFDQTKRENFEGSEEMLYGMSVYNSVRKRNGNEATVTLSLSTIPYDIFYSTYQTPYNISVKWGYSKDDISNNATETSSSNTITFSFNHNTKQDTFVKTIVSDAAGNRKEIIRAIPSQAVINSVSKTTDSFTTWDSINLSYANDTLYQSLCDYYGASSFIKWTIIKNTTEGDASWYKDSSRPTLIDTNWGSTNKTFIVYAVIGFKYGDTTSASDQTSEYWLSSLSDEYIEVKMNATDFQKIDSYSKKNSVTTGLSSAYIVDKLKVSTEPVSNSGCYKVVLDDEFLDRVTLDTTGITYTVIAKKYNSNNSIETTYESKNFTFYLPSPGKYQIHLKAENSNRQSTSESSWRDLQINGGTNTSERYLNFTEDLTAPNFYIPSDENFASITPASYSSDFTLKDEEGGSGLVKDSSGNVLVDYYLIPCSSLNFSIYVSEVHKTYQYLHDSYTLKELEDQYSHLKKTIAVPLNNSGAGTFSIPFDGADEGLYTISLVAKDNNGNYSVKNRTAFNKRLGREFVFTYRGSEGSSYDAIESDTETKFNIYWASGGKTSTTVSTYGETYPWRASFSRKWYDNNWLKIIPAIKNNLSVATSGFYDVTYVCLGYQRQFFEEGAEAMTVSSKNIISGWNGLQILCDAPTFAHTMYCKKNLSTDTDEKKNIKIWENCAQETGFVSDNSNFTYGNENYESVPSGYYYTTIVHFADGTTLMSEVKQK
ncbi:MAG: hypothetical protein K6D95_06330 [Treponema sp.]|nr:hypothetical protein [Treponema sp.]